MRCEIAAASAGSSVHRLRDTYGCLARCAQLIKKVLAGRSCSAILNRCSGMAGSGSSRRLRPTSLSAGCARAARGRRACSALRVVASSGGRPGFWACGQAEYRSSRRARTAERCAALCWRTRNMVGSDCPGRSVPRWRLRQAICSTHSSSPSGRWPWSRHLLPDLRLANADTILCSALPVEPASCSAEPVSTAPSFRRYDTVVGSGTRPVWDRPLARRICTSP